MTVARANCCGTCDAILADREQRATATVPDVPLDPADARTLARLGKAVDRYTAERNDLIRRLIAQGAGVREVARAVGLAPATVLNIVKPKVRR